MEVSSLLAILTMRDTAVDKRNASAALATVNATSTNATQTTVHVPTTHVVVVQPNGTAHQDNPWSHGGWLKRPSKALRTKAHLFDVAAAWFAKASASFKRGNRSKFNVHRVDLIDRDTDCDDVTVHARDISQAKYDAIEDQVENAETARDEILKQVNAATTDGYEMEEYANSMRYSEEAEEKLRFYDNKDIFPNGADYMDKDIFKTFSNDFNLDEVKEVAKFEKEQPDLFEKLKDAAKALGQSDALHDLANGWRDADIDDKVVDRYLDNL